MILRPSLAAVCASCAGVALAKLAPALRGQERRLGETTGTGVVYEGCFNISQLDLQEVGVSQDTRNVTFASELGFAITNRMAHFGISRYDSAYGKAYLITGIHGEPQYGAQEECGTRCQDDDSRWCGCANDPSENPVFKVNDACEIGAQMVAVYAVPAVKKHSIGIIVLYCCGAALVVIEVIALVIFWWTRPPLRRRMVTEKEMRQARRAITMTMTGVNSMQRSGTSSISSSTGQESNGSETDTEANDVAKSQSEAGEAGEAASV